MSLPNPEQELLDGKEQCSKCQRIFSKDRMEASVFANYDPNFYTYHIDWYCQNCDPDYESTFSGDFSNFICNNNTCAQRELSDIATTFSTQSSPKTQGVLYNTKTYLIGHMEYIDGSEWRKNLKCELHKMGITAYDPYDKPFMEKVDEDGDNLKRRRKQIKLGHYDDVAREMRKVRSFDLNLVDRSDFIICHLRSDVATWGTAEELFWANRCKKPCFVSIEGGKKNTPLWLLGTLPHKYFYDSIDDILNMIKKINSDKKKIDSDRWRLLKPNLR